MSNNTFSLKRLCTFLSACDGWAEDNRTLVVLHRDLGEINDLARALDVAPQAIKIVNAVVVPWLWVREFGI